MERLKKYLLLLGLCFYLNHGVVTSETVKQGVKDVEDIEPLNKLLDKLASDKKIAPLMSNYFAKEALNNTNITALTNNLAKEALNNKNFTALVNYLAKEALNGNNLTALSNKFAKEALNNKNLTALSNNLAKEVLNNKNLTALSNNLAKELLNNKNLAVNLVRRAVNNKNFHVISNELKAVINKKLINKLLRVFGAIFRTAIVLGLQIEGWHLTSRILAGGLTVIYGSNVFILIPLLTKIGIWISRSGNPVAVGAAVTLVVNVLFVLIM